LIKNVLPVANFDENEVGGGGNGFQAQLAEGASIEFQPARVKTSRLLGVALIIERGQRAGLGQRVDVEWLANLFQFGDQFGMADAVANAQAGQAVNLRECPHEQQVRLSAAA